MFAILIYNGASKRTFTLYTEPEWLLHDIRECQKCMHQEDRMEVKGIL